MKIDKAVALAALAATSGLGCTTPAREPAPQSTVTTSSAPTSTPPAPLPNGAGSGVAPQEPPVAQPAPSASASPTPESRTGSAYFGCGQSILIARLWDETTESQVLAAIGDAKRCAAEHGRRLMLEFVAPWCDDCREMARLDETELVAKVRSERFERVRINVGKWDRHEALRENYAVKALATYIVIDPKTSQLLAKTTLEPITKKHGKKLTAEDWATWLRAH